MARRFNTNPIEIESLLSDIQRGELALPEFQRDFVWSPGETASLLTSIIQGYPAGSLLLWSPGQAEVAARSFTGAPDLYTENPRLVLDGQQRLTSLYHAFYATGGYEFFVNLRALLAKDPDLDDIIKWIPKVSLSGRRFDTLGIQEKRQFEELLFPLERLRVGIQGFSTWCFERQKAQVEPKFISNGEALDFRLTTIGNEWIRSLVDYQFPVVEMTKDADVDAVCHIFEKVNSTGETLTMFELLTARFWAKGINIRELWGQAQNTRHGILRTFNIDPVEILRVISLLAGVPDPGRPSAVFKLSDVQIRQHWSDAVRGVGMALELLRDEFGVLDDQWLPYAPMLIPLAAIEARRSADSKREEGGRLLRLHRWYWCSVFSNAYIQGAAKRAVNDYHSLAGWLDDPLNSPAPDAVRAFAGFPVERLKEISRKQQAEYKACIGIILRRNPRDLVTGDRLAHGSESSKHLQRRSIFPKKVLGTKVPKALQDSVLNVTMTRTKMTGALAQDPPSVWLENARKRLGGRLPEILDEHLLPSSDKSSMDRDSFDRFLEERTERFADEISSLTGVPCFSTVEVATRR